MTPLQDTSPVHWTYESVTPDSDLQQGDILEFTDNIRDLCKQIHPYFDNDKFLGFMVITQSCDLVRRKKNNCNAHYINLAVMRSLEDILPTLLDSVCVSLAPCVYSDESKDEANKLLSRIFNQNEQALGLFYLHPDEQAGVAVPSVVLLRVSVSFRAEHYKTFERARRGRLKPEFKSKLGWLTGNLFSRIGTTDWSESSDRKEWLDKLIALFMGYNESQQSEKFPLWVNKTCVNAAIKAGENFNQLKKDEILSTITKYAPPTPKEDIVKTVKENIKKVIPEIADEAIAKIANRLIKRWKIKCCSKKS